jgi:cobyrinic acid a,c-diamide synthase
MSRCTTAHRQPGLVVGALRGGSGKTIISIGISAALTADRLRIAPFKKGPDYIDAGWLALAAGRPCYNLDTFLIDGPVISQSFARHSSGCDLALVEGNRGIYDCIDTHGHTSTAELAKLLGLPLLLVIDGTKTTRTMAAVVAGCRQFDPGLRIGGVVLNRVAGARHESILRRSIEEHCGIPVVGAVPKLDRQRFPERHMGLVPTWEHAWAREAVAAAAAMARGHLDLAAIQALARESGFVPPESGLWAAPPASEAPAAPGEAPRIGVLRDSAFQFYYPENLEALEAAGGRICLASPLEGGTLPDIDALYIGGGFPETHAEALAANEEFRRRLCRLVEEGLPVYAECGGLMYLGERLVLDHGTYAMAGVLPVVFGFERRPQGHGYTVVQVDRPNPFFPVGTTLKGHEFHYSRVLEFRGEAEDLAYAMQRGTGIVAGRDGLCRRNVLATYTHLHALGVPTWAPALVSQARAFRRQKRGRRAP